MIQPDLAKLFAAIAAAFPQWKPEPSTFEIYALALSDIPIERLRAAFVQHIRTSRFAPTVAELREADELLQGVLRGIVSDLTWRITAARDRIALIQAGQAVKVYGGDGVERIETVEELEAGITRAEERVRELTEPRAALHLLQVGGQSA